MNDNPIISVDGKEVPSPSSFVWSLSDISADDAGRTEDMVMHKNRKGQAVTLQMSWRYVTTAEASQILKAFNPEYVFVTYIDPLEGGTRRREFYVGDRNSPMYNGALGLWEEVSFTIIQRGPDKTTAPDET